MFSLSWLLERGVTRGRPTTRRAVRIVAMGGMIVAGLLQTGCQSGPCGSRLFGPCSFAGRATSKLIVQPARRVASVFGHGPEYAYDAPIEYAEPIGVVAPVVPFGTTAPVIEGVPVPSTVAPVNPDAPTSLEPLPSAEPGPEPSSRGSGVRKPSSYDAQRPGASPNRGDNLAHTLVSTPDPSVAPTREAAKPLSRTAAVTDLDGVLDDLPPLDLPAEVTERGDTPPVAPAAVRAKPDPKAKAESASLDSASVAAPAPANDYSPSGRSGREAGSESDIHPPPAPQIDPAPSKPLGITRFVAVDLKLAGGSAPSTVGLGWLADKGYKTVLDLRNTSEFDASFIGEAAKRGLRYVSFPTDLEKLDRGHINRFSAELSLNDARPLYFFDDDGSRAGALWFIRRVVADKVAWDIARREAEEIGLLSGDAWREVHEAVDRQLAHAAAPATPRTTIQQDAEIQAPPESETPVAEPSKPAPATPAKPTASVEAPDRISSVVEAIQSSAPSLPDSWRPAAALVVTSLSFPLAYFGRSVIPVILAKTRASLPGPGPQPKSLPSSSDA